MSLFAKTTPKDNGLESLLDQTLYTVPGTGTDITWADCVEGTLILGSTGSGKSSGPGRHVAISMLKQGFGFCILCAKPDERKHWEDYIEKEAPQRVDDLVVFSRSTGLNFNFLEYEMTRTGEGAGEILNIVSSLMSLNEQNRIHQGGGEGREDKFWDNSLRRMINRTVSLLKFTDQEVSIFNMRKVVSNCFRDRDPEVYNHLKRTINSQEEIDPGERKKAVESLNKWVQSNYFVRLIEKLRLRKAGGPLEEDEIHMVYDYWVKEYPKLAEKPASIIMESFMGIIEPFMNRGILREQFASGISQELKPENIIKQKKIVIIDFPLKEYGMAGIYAATIYKTTFQAAMERRKIEEEESPKPVALWIDEYQSFCSPMSDSLFQTTARSSWVATVYITQNIQNLYFSMGRNMPEARAKSLLGNLNLKYFCSQSDADTNSWASNMIGEHMTHVPTVSVSSQEKVSKSVAQQMRYRITPDHFTTLKTGRKTNKNIVEAVVFKAGKTWGRDKENYAVCEFRQ